VGKCPLKVGHSRVVIKGRSLEADMTKGEWNFMGEFERVVHDSKENFFSHQPTARQITIAIQRFEWALKRTTGFRNEWQRDPSCRYVGVRQCLHQQLGAENLKAGTSWRTGNQYFTSESASMIAMERSRRGA